MDHSRNRKKWSQGNQEIQMPLNVPSAKEEVPPQYEHYLHLLHERNRLVRRLRQKDKKQIELEKKEKGFTLYLNSAVASKKESKVRADRKNCPQRAKTAGAADHVNKSSHKTSDVSKSSALPSKAREKRRNWQIGSVELTTADGHKQKVKAPEILTGKYQEDFEVNSSDDDRAEILRSFSSLDLDDDEDCGDVGNSVSSSTSSLNSARRHKTSYLKRVAAAKREEIETENRMTIRMEDVKKLRESLQMNKLIRQSVAENVDSDGSDGERVSPIGEDIEETISSEDEEKDGGKNNVKLFHPGDTLVLEFKPLPTKSKQSANLSAARKKTTDSNDLSNSSKKSVSTSSTSLSSSPTKSITPKAGARKTAQPLSASRKSPSSNNADSKEEANSVIKALQAENKKVELFSKVTRPLPQPRVAAGPATPSTSGSDHGKPPTPVKSSADPEQAGQRSQLATDEKSTINSVLHRVLKMDPRQQKQLLQTLNHIDVDDRGLAISKSDQPLQALRASWSSRAPVTDRLELTFEIMSNWGHPSLVGLTELQFFNPTGALVPVQPSDVSVHGARGSSNKVDVLFNGKAKTTKERNMWSCRFEGRPVEFSILVINPNPGKPFLLGAVKVWNWNNKLNNLDIGARNVRIFFGGELLFSGEVDKGCGNQVFDYSNHILLSKASSPSKASKASSKPDLSLNVGKNMDSPPSRPSLPGSPSKQRMTSPQKGLNSPSPADKMVLTPSGSHHVFRSISRSSQSSASSSGSHHSARDRGKSQERVGGSSQAEERDSKHVEGSIRSETRTLMRPTVLNRRGSGDSSPDIDMSANGFSMMPEKKRAQTPLKTKRVAAKLNRRSSETENSSKSNADSYESKPPLPPTQKSDDKTTAASRSQTGSMRPKLSPKSSQSEPHLSPMLSPPPGGAATAQRHSGGREEEALSPTIVDKMKTMGQNEAKRKKDIPNWLKGEGLTEEGESETGHLSSRQEASRAGNKQEEEMDIQEQLDKEFEQFSQAGSQSGADRNLEEEADTITPMKKIEKTRAKWRNREEALEESWGSLTFFNKSQRGRLSLDMGDDEMDEYLSPAKKPSTEVTPKLPLPDDNWSDEDNEFTIPELPYGRELVINIKTTWGDHHYVGLTSVQLFSSQGNQVNIDKIWANPSDINILSEYTRDPRVITNIVDNVNRTRDDVHMWLAPFTAGNNHLIYITFTKPCKLALMRLWNYNKSRIHSFRGAKDLVITLDGTEIFKGEIARACGGIEGGTEAFGDTILFTTDERILDAVSKNDDAFEGDMFSDDVDDVPCERPSTADADDETRPFTRATGLMPAGHNTPRPTTTSLVTSVGDMLVYKANKLQLLFTETWGDHHYLGLTGMEVVGGEGEAVPITLNDLTASPKDLRHLPGNEKDERTLDKLIDGTNLTCQDSHMWLVPFVEGESHTLTVTFPQQTVVSGVRLWNYNKSPEDTYRGAKVMHVQINDRVVSPPEGYLLRKGPGVCHFDFAQEISFSSSAAGPTPEISRHAGTGDPYYEDVVQMPRGFIFQLQLFSTWGDQYYIGLNGLEFYDGNFQKIELTETNISAYPDSVNVLDNVSGDARTPDKLIDGVNDTVDGRHMWLAPILPTIINRVYVIFDQPTSVSMIKLWNYSKTVGRGVKDFALLVDDLLVYNGTLQTVTPGPRGIVPTCSAPIPHHTILFSDNKDIVRKEKNAIISNQTEDQDIQLSNDKQIVSKFAKSSSTKPANQALRPKTSVTKTARR